MKTIRLKTKQELIKLRQSGKILAQVFQMVEKETLFPGATGQLVEATAKKYIKKFDAQPAFLGFDGYPAVSCVSINHQLVHGLPNNRPFQNGDIVSIDIGVKFQGFYSDKARTYGIGKINPVRQKLIEVSQTAFQAGLNAARPGNRLGDISHAIQKVIEQAGFSVVRDLAGHGIGRELHEPPSIYNYGHPGTGPRLKAGMVFALEPMLSAGSEKIKITSDRWTIETADQSDSSHFEDTIEITEKEPLVLTII